MRLLNAKTLKFEDFIGEAGDGIPPYAILSHTWGAEEVSYSAYINQQDQSKEGYQKILRCCGVAESEGFEYVWIDTCCIDKSSSAELSEAINSMFQWYRDAGICYAYLSDVDSREDPAKDGTSFARSRWFTRGWTLQELLAPTELVFLAVDWVEIGSKKSLREPVSQVTRISTSALKGSGWSGYSVAQKMSWAAGRNTTRLEDEAYCLMGLFDVKMPLLYGEGRKAFSRLQQEILKQTDDPSIFAWSLPIEDHSHAQTSGLFAESPEYFKDASKIELMRPENGVESESPFQVVNQLIRLRQRLFSGVEAIKIQRFQEQPRLCNITELKRDRQTKQEHLSTLASTLETKPNPDLRAEAGIAQTQPLLPVPIVTIVIEDISTEKPVERLVLSPEDVDKMISENQGVKGRDRDQDFDQQYRDYVNSAIGEWKDPLDGSDTSLGAEGAVPLEERWYTYIYEPAMIVQLRCHIGRRPLGIILSRSSVRTDGSVLRRLHNPSIVGVETVPSPPPFTTVYANIFTNASDKPLIRGMGRRLWPDVLITSVLANGYKVHEECGPGWEFSSSRRALVPKNDQDKWKMTDLESFAVFQPAPSEETSFPVRAFFINLRCYRMDTGEISFLECEIGVDKHIPLYRSAFMDWDYDLYDLRLPDDSEAEISIGNGQALVLKYRISSSVVTASIETLKEWKAAKPKTPGEIGFERRFQLRSKIPRMLRYLQ